MAAFDDKGQRVVSALFNFYYNNPRILHRGTLQRIYIEMCKKSNNVIHFQEGDISLVNDEWRRIKHPKESPSLRDIRELFPNVDFSQYSCVDDFYKTLDSDDKRVVHDYIENCIDEYKEKNRILVLAICDFISGMTDSYALMEYRKLTL